MSEKPMAQQLPEGSAIPISGIRVTVEDLQTGDSESAVIWNDYIIITAGTCYVSGVQGHGNGTQVLTVKGSKR